MLEVVGGGSILLPIGIGRGDLNRYLVLIPNPIKPIHFLSSLGGTTGQKLLASNSLLLGSCREERRAEKV